MEEQIKIGCQKLECYLYSSHKLVYQDNEWWIFASDGNGIISGNSILNLILKIGKNDST
jgi:hypothetical protein